MLQGIHISNFMLFEHVDITVEKSFIVVTGETGAGKSLFLQSLKFLSGGKKPISPPPDQSIPTSVSCTLSLSSLKHIDPELAETLYPILREQSAQTIEIKRTLTPEGKSKMTIAGRHATVTQVKSIMQKFFDINAQHQHLGILEEQSQRTLLDRYGNHIDLSSKTAQNYHHWQTLLNKQKKLQIALANLDDPDYLQAILDDIATLNLDTIDLNDLHQQQQQLQKRQSFLQSCQSLHQKLDCDSQYAILSQIHQAQSSLDEYHHLYPETKDISQLLQDANTLCQEASSTLQTMLDCDYSLDAEKLQSIESQLSAAHDCARKYRTLPENLNDFAETTAQSMEKYQQYKSEITQLSDQISLAEKCYMQSATALSAQRLTTAEQLSSHIISQLPSLNLPHANFHIKVGKNQKQPSEFGTDRIDFLFSGNPGICLTKLADCASGGELARLSLLLSASIPSAYQKTLIFDEADVGVSGKTASLIGKLMQNIAQQHQIICLTHSPQVAACGLQHWHIVKEHQNDRTLTQLHSLDDEAHIQEVARLLSGMDLSAESLASARQLCLQD